MDQLIKFASLFLMCSFAFKMGFPTAYFVLQEDFGVVMLVTCSGGIAGNIIFTNLSAALIKAIHNFRAKRGMIHKKKVFTRSNRRIINIKRKFGLAGIAFITPVFLSTPIGAFLAERFYKDKKRIIIYLSVATILWGFAMYLILSFFHGTLREWLV